MNKTGALKWADVAHHYTKSDVAIFVEKFDQPGDENLFSAGLHEAGCWGCSDDGLLVEAGLSQWGNHKPILRPITAMTDGERAALWRLVFSQGCGANYHEGFRTFRGRSFRIEDNNPRWIMTQGVERIGIQDDGDVWADCDLHRWTNNPHLITHWLLSKGFDLFGLIESGQALRKAVKA